MTHREPIVSGRKVILDHPFIRVDEVTFQLDRLEKEITHVVIERGDSVGMLVHDVHKDEVILVQQFRIATVRRDLGYMIEIPAGRIDPEETADDACRRELSEEIGADVDQIQLIASFYPSPGACSERLHLYYCKFESGVSTALTGGLASENEELKVLRWSVPYAMRELESGRLNDAKTIIALQWLKSNQNR